MKSLGELFDKEKPETLIVQVKGNGQLQTALRKQTRLGYVLVSQEPQGRKRIVLTFRLAAA